MKEYENLMTDIIVDAVDECKGEFDLGLDAFDGDLEGTFERVTEEKLRELEKAKAEAGKFPIERIREIIEACKRDFSRQIQNAIDDAFYDAGKSFEASMEEIVSDMIDTINTNVYSDEEAKAWVQKTGTSE